MKKLKSVLALTIVSSLVLALSACGKTENSGNTDKPAETKKLVMGTSADYAPYEFHKLVDGKDTIMGFDIDLAKEIAKDMGRELEIKDMSFDSLLVEMNMGKIDLVIAGMSPDPKRDADFSDTYYIAEQVCVVRKEDADKYKDIASLEGKSVGAQMGSIQEGLVKDNFTKSTPLSLQKIPDLVQNLKAKKADAVVMERPVAEGYIANNADLVAAFNVPYEQQGSCVAVKKGNKELLDEINKTIKRVKEDGTMDKFIAKANEDAEY